MKLRHFRAIRPLCAVCRQDPGEEIALELGRVVSLVEEDVLEGLLLCPRCQREYPILDGVPLLLPALRSYVAQNIFHLIQRDDLSELTESVLGDCCGPGSPLDSTRQHLSSYARGHYGDLDPDGGDAGSTLLDLLSAGLAQAGNPARGRSSTPAAPSGAPASSWPSAPAGWCWAWTSTSPCCAWPRAPCATAR